MTDPIAFVLAELRVVMREELEDELTEMREAVAHFRKLASEPKPLALDARVDANVAGTTFGRFKGDE